MTLSNLDVTFIYNKLTAAMDLMKPTLEYIGCHEESDPACALGIKLILESITMLAKDRNITKDHPGHFEWTDEDWSARIREGKYAGAEYALHRKYIKTRHGIDLPEPIYPVRDEETIRTLIKQQKDDFWMTDLVEEHNLDPDTALLTAERMVALGELEHGDSKGVADYEFCPRG